MQTVGAVSVRIRCKKNRSDPNAFNNFSLLGFLFIAPHSAIDFASCFVCSATILKLVPKLTTHGKSPLKQLPVEGCHSIYQSSTGWPSGHSHHILHKLAIK